MSLDWSSFIYGFILAIIMLVLYKLLGIFVFKSDKYKVTDINNINKSSYNTNNISRHATYLPPVPNTWYHLCNSDDIKPGNKPIYIRALGQNLVVWRTIEVLESLYRAQIIFHVMYGNDNDPQIDQPNQYNLIVYVQLYDVLINAIYFHSFHWI